MRVNLSGHLVGYINRPYDFTDDQTGQRMVGQSRKMWVASTLDEEPTLITVQKDDPQAVAAFDSLQTADFLAAVDLVVTTGRYNKLVGLAEPKTGK